MAEKETEHQAPEQSRQANPSPGTRRAGRTSIVSVLLSGLAVLLAVLALVASLAGGRSTNTQLLDAITSKLSGLEERINHVEALMTMGKHSLVQAELKKILLNIRELSRLSDAKTKAEISKAEGILLRLTTPPTRVKAKVDLKSTEQAAPGTEKKSQPAAGAPQAMETEKQAVPEAQTTPAESPAAEEKAGNKASTDDTHTAKGPPAGER